VREIVLLIGWEGACETELDELYWRVSSADSVRGVTDRLKPGVGILLPEADEEERGVAGGAGIVLVACVKDDLRGEEVEAGGSSLCLRELGALATDELDEIRDPVADAVGLNDGRTGVVAPVVGVARALEAGLEDRPEIGVAAPDELAAVVDDGLPAGLRAEGVEGPCEEARSRRGCTYTPKDTRK
jgi:hypothetical protein